VSTPKKIGEGYVTAIHRFAEVNGIPVVHFKKRGGLRPSRIPRQGR
jgi:hypothetical protein